MTTNSLLAIGVLLVLAAGLMWLAIPTRVETPEDPPAPLTPHDPRASILYDTSRDRPTEFLPTARLRADRPLTPGITMDPTWRPTAVPEPPREPATPPSAPSGVSSSHRSPEVYVPILGTNLHCPNCRCRDRS